MKVFRWLRAALSTYSKIPVPSYEMKDDDMNHCIMFLPILGVIIGAVMFGAIRLFTILRVPISAKALIATVVPLLITGGFHVDGFMDTVDALSSYGSKDKKLEIMKDPHTGAFAVTRFAAAGLIMLAALTILISIETTKDTPVFIFACFVFVISRALSAVTSVAFKKAKQDGMLVDETGKDDTAVIAVVLVQLFAALSFMAYLDLRNTLIISGAFLLFVLYYRHMTYKNFEGVTGDTAGYFVTAGEVFVLTVLAVAQLIIFA